MIAENTIQKILAEKIQDSGLFLYDIQIKSGNSIHVYIDGDQSVTVDNCVEISRYIESQLDRETEDFNLQVSSPGADQPLKFARQYPKNVGRRLSIALKDGGNLEGKLLSYDSEKIQVQTEIKKGRKVLQGEMREIYLADIDKAYIIISFKQHDYNILSQ